MYKILVFGLIVVLVLSFVPFLLKRSLKSLKIRAKLKRSLLTQAVLLSMILFVFITLFFYETSIASTKDKILAIAKSKVVHIESTLDSTGEDIQMIVAGESYKAMFDSSIDYETRYNHVKREMDTIRTSHNDYVSLKILSKDGYVMVSSSTDEGEYIGDTEVFKEGLKGIFYGDPHICEETGIKIMSIVSPIFVENEVEGVLLANYNVEGFEAITLSTDGLEENGEIFIFTDKKYAITKLQKSEEYDIIPLGEDFCSDCESLIESNEEILLTGLDYSGTNVMYTVLKVGDTDWYLFVQMDYLEVLTPIFQIILLELAIFILILIMSRRGAKRISDSIAKPIEELTENVGLVTKGNWEKKVATDSKDEIGILSRDIDKMTGAILKSQREVEKKVKIQTEALSLQEENLRKQQLALLNILEDVAFEKEEIDKERSKLDIILGGIGDGVFVVDKDYVITRFNKVAEEITGFSAKEAIGKKCKDILIFRKEKDDSLYYDFIHKAIKDGKTQNMANHTYLVRKDDSHVQVADSAAPVFDEQGKVAGCVVVFRDVTKEREINDVKDEFVSVASHQLRTPLTGIKWFLQILTKEEKGKLNKDQKTYIKNIYDSNERMIKLVDDLLSVSRIDTGKKFDIRKKKINIVSTVQNIINIQSVIARKREIEVICQKSCPTEMMVNVDESKISEVFANVLSNAVKYSKAKGKVNISVKKEKEAYVFAIKDNGLGIPKAQQKQIFEKFFRAENVKKHQVGGNGLGLYIAKSIMLAHDGDIWFESKEGKGTTFFIKIKKA